MIEWISILEVLAVTMAFIAFAIAFVVLVAFARRMLTQVKPQLVKVSKTKPKKEKPKMSKDIAVKNIGSDQGLVSKGSRSRGNSYVCEIISAGKMTEITLTPIIPIANKNTT